MALVNNESASIGGFGGMPFGVPVGGFGGGFGGGALGIEALILLALFGGRDGFGGGRGNNDASDSTAALATVIAALNNRDDSKSCECVLTAILSKLGSVEGQIPAVGAELQLALQGAIASLTAQGNANAAALTSQLNSLGLNQLVQSNAIQTAIAAVDTNVDRQSCETRGAIFQSEARIVALINANETARLTAANVVLANEVAELRSDARHNDHRRELDGIRISIENNNAAVAAQAQAQQQSQRQLVDQENRFNHERLLAQFNSVVQQFARATNSNVIVGNTGASTTGAQTASPTNVNAL